MTIGFGPKILCGSKEPLKIAVWANPMQKSDSLLVLDSPTMTRTRTQRDAVDENVPLPDAEWCLPVQ